MALISHEVISKIFKAHPDLRRRFKNEVLTSTATTKAYIRHADSYEARLLARKIATTSWNEDPYEKIRRLVIYICNMLVENGHRKYKPKTVKDWIKDLDPGRGNPRHPASKT